MGWSITDSVSSAASWARSQCESAVDAGAKAIDGTVDAVRETAGQAGDAIAGAVESAGPVLRRVASAVGEAHDAIGAGIDRAGKAIDTAVHSAEKTIDDSRKALVEFGQAHGGVVGKALAQDVSDGIGLAEGAALAAYDMGSGLATLARGAGRVADPIEWAMHPGRNLQRVETTATALTTLAKLGTPTEWLLHPQDNLKTGGALINGLTAGYQDAARTGDWSKAAGRLVVDVGSFFVGAGEANAAVKGAQGAEVAARVAGEATNALAHVAEEGAALAGRAEGGGKLGAALIEGVSESRAGARPMEAPWLDSVSNLRKDGTFLQCRDGSCVSATAQNITRQAVTESEMLSRIGEWSNSESLAKALNEAQVHGGGWIGGMVSESNTLMLARRGMIGAELQVPGQAAHMVAIAPVEGAKDVFKVLDTGIGASYEVDAAWINKYVSKIVAQP